MMSMMCRPSIYTNELINLNLDLYQIHFQKVPMIYQMKIFTLFKLCVQFLLKPRYVSKMKEKNRIYIPYSLAASRQKKNNKEYVVRKVVAIN